MNARSSSSLSRRTSRLSAVALVASALAVAPFVPAQAATVPLGTGDCQATDNATTMTYTLQGSCSTSSSISLPDGYTLDGGGFTITAVDGQSPFLGAYVLDQAGTGSINARNLTIRGGFASSSSHAKLSGVSLLDAGGTFTNVDIENMASANGFLDDGFVVSSPDLSSPPTVRMSHVTVRGWRSYGIDANGVNLKADHLNIGRGVAGSSGAAPYGVHLLLSTASTITDSRLVTNIAPPTEGPGQPAAAIFSETSTMLTLAHDRVTGANGDDGIYVSTDLQSGTAVNVSCSSIVRTSATSANPAYGFGIDVSTPVPLRAARSAAPTPGATTVQVGGVTFAGWTANYHNVKPTVVPASCSTGGISLHANSNRVDDDRGVHLFGRVSPVHAGRIVAIQRLSQGVWRTVRRTPERRSGRFSASYHQEKLGRFQFRARVASAGGHVSTSHPVAVRFVEKYPG